MSVQEKKNKESNIKPFSWFSSTTTKATAESMVSPFIPLYATHLGANSTLIGLLVSISSLLNIVQIFWAKIAEKYHKIRIIAIFTNFFSSIFYYLYLFTQRVGLFIGLRASQSFFTAGSIPTSSAVFIGRTKRKDYAFWNSLGQFFMVFGALIGILSAGLILAYFVEAIGFKILFLFAGTLSIISAVLFYFAVPSQERLQRKKQWTEIEEVDISIDNVFAIMKTDKNFGILTAVSFIFVFGVHLSAPFYIIYNKSFYNLDIFRISLISAGGLFPQMLTSLLTARFIHRIRKKELLMLSSSFTSLFPFVYVLPYFLPINRSFYFLLGLWIINGAAWGFINGSLIGLIIDIIHPRRRTLQLAIINAVSSIASFLGPILGGLILQFTADLFIIMFIVSGIIRLIGTILFILVKEPVIGGTILRPLGKIFKTISIRNLEKAGTLLVMPLKKKRNHNQQTDN